MNSRYLLLFLLPIFLLKPLFGEEGSKPTVVFDYGGVLATADKEEFHAFVAKVFAIRPEEVRDLLKQVRKLRKKTKDDAMAWEKVAKIRGASLPKAWGRRCEEQMLGSIHERPKMMDLVRELKRRGYRVAMLSNVSRREARLVKKLGYYAPFDPVLLSCEIGVSKPKLQSFRILLKRLKREGKEIIFIDDQEQNINAASKLGIDGIQFSSYDQLIEALARRNILGCLTK